MNYSTRHISPRSATARRVVALRAATLRPASPGFASQRDRQVAGIRKGASLRTICPTSQHGSLHLCAGLRSTALRRATLLTSTQRKTVRSPASSGAGFRAICPTSLRFTAHLSARHRTTAYRVTVRRAAAPCPASQAIATDHLNQFPRAAHLTTALRPTAFRCVPHHVATSLCATHRKVQS